jgi:hypothetical protein
VEKQRWKSAPLAPAVAMAVALWGAGCANSAPANPCTPGRTVSCPCPGGESGAQTCQADGTFGECDCAGGAMDAGVDSGGSGDGSADALADTGTSAFTGCTTGSKRPPERPPSDTDAQSIPEVVFALKDVVMSNANASLNVDRMCTSNGGPWTCLPPPELERYLAGESFTVPPDGPWGEENQFAREVYALINGLVQAAQGATVEISAQIAQGGGVGSPLLRIQDYNGEANDPQVTVVLSQSVFALAGDPGATAPPAVCIREDPSRGGVPHVPHVDDDAWTCWGEVIPDLPAAVEYDSGGAPIAVTSYDPAWEEARVWAWARRDTFGAGGNPDLAHFMDDTAYVRDWILVARLPDNVELKLTGAGRTVAAKLTDAFLVAFLVPDMSGTYPDGVLLAGRWSMNAVLETFESVGICQGTPEHSIARRQLEARTDVRFNRFQEALDVACDAFSFGMTFTAHRAHWGGITLGQPVSNACAP